MHHEVWSCRSWIAAFQRRCCGAAVRHFISTVAGGGSGDLFDGSLATSGKLSEVIGLAAHSSGNVYFQEFSAFYPTFLGILRRVRKISPDGIVTTIAGTGDPGYSGDGGPAILAQLNPRADERGNNLALGHAGNLYVADAGNNALRVLHPIREPVLIGAVIDAASQRADALAPGKIVVSMGSAWVLRN